jgi:hypothetical protein
LLKEVLYILFLEEKGLVYFYFSIIFFGEEILIIIILDFDFIINKISQKKFKLEFKLSPKHISVGTIISDFAFF